MDFDEVVHLLKAWMRQMSDAERVELFREMKDEYCQYCGGPSGCHCWNDE